MTKKLLYVAAAILVVLIVLGYWQFFLGFACGVALFWYLGESLVKEQVQQLFSKGKELGSELKDKVTPSNKREELHIVSVSELSEVEGGKFAVALVCAGNKVLLIELMTKSVPQEFVVGNNIVLETNYNLHQMPIKSEQTVIAGNQKYRVLQAN